MKGDTVIVGAAVCVGGDFNQDTITLQNLLIHADLANYIQRLGQTPTPILLALAPQQLITYWSRLYSIILLHPL